MPTTKALAHRIEMYAAKLAADSVTNEPPSPADLSDDGLTAAFRGCVRPAKLDEYPAIRAMFTARYASTAVWYRYWTGREWRPAYVVGGVAAYLAPGVSDPWRPATAAERATFQRRIPQDTVGRISDDSLYLTPTTYATLNELAVREIVGALDNAECYDIPAIVDALRAADLIVWSDASQGFELVTDEEGVTPGFWDVVYSHAK